jgi:hypothetical protein
MQCNCKGSQRHAATVLLQRTSKGRHGPLQAASSIETTRVRSSAGSDEAAHIANRETLRAGWEAVRRMVQIREPVFAIRLFIVHMKDAQPKLQASPLPTNMLSF